MKVRSHPDSAGLVTGKGIVNRAWVIQFIKLIVSLVFSLVLASCLSNARAQIPNEYQVKAAFLFNFAKFVEWPVEAFSHSDGKMPLIIGVMGNESFSKAIESVIDGKTVSGRQLVIKRLKWGQNLRTCHILYISSYEQRHLTQILESLKGSSILTVGEMDQFTQQGGIINLLTEEDRVLFEVNLDVAEQAQLKISSKLLTLAKTVRGKARAGKE
ncbi:MAG TPA: YfiR family protein [Blastocatellia bacterium]|nr:YfiR family protein [Blastocatellia bacterium]